jgi:hypothetical protein
LSGDFGEGWGVWGRDFLGIALPIPIVSREHAGYLLKRVVDTTERFLHFLQVDSLAALKNSPGVLLIMMFSV